jgi:hypothetical protein
MGPAANCSLEGAGGASFLPVRAPAVALEGWPHLGLRRLVRAYPGQLGIWLDPVALLPPLFFKGRAGVGFALADFDDGRSWLVRAALGRQWRFANLPLGGGGLRTEAAVLNNPAAGRMPTDGKAPSCGLPFTGREPHAIHGVTLPLTVILTVHRLRATRHSARQTARTLALWLKQISRRWI